MTPWPTVLAWAFTAFTVLLLLLSLTGSGTMRGGIGMAWMAFLVAIPALVLGGLLLRMAGPGAPT